VALGKDAVNSPDSKVWTAFQSCCKSDEQMFRGEMVEFHRSMARGVQSSKEIILIP